GFARRDRGSAERARLGGRAGALRAARPRRARLRARRRRARRPAGAVARRGHPRLADDPPRPVDQRPPSRPRPADPAPGGGAGGPGAVDRPARSHRRLTGRAGGSTVGPVKELFGYAATTDDVTVRVAVNFLPEQ